MLSLNRISLIDDDNDDDDNDDDKKALEPVSFTDTPWRLEECFTSCV